MKQIQVRDAIFHGCLLSLICHVGWCQYQQNEHVCDAVAVVLAQWIPSWRVFLLWKQAA